MAPNKGISDPKPRVTKIKGTNVKFSEDYYMQRRSAGGTMLVTPRLLEAAGMAWGLGLGSRV